MANSFRNEASDYLYEWVTKPVFQKHGFIQQQNTAMLLGDAQLFRCGFDYNYFCQ